MSEAELPDPAGPRRPSAWLWAIAGLAAVVVHAGAFAAFLAERPTDAVDDTGAPAFAIGVELASPHTEATDLPPGPESEASAAFAAAVEQKTAVEDSELPKAVPTETEDPDRIVAAEPTKKPEQDEPVTVTPPATASQESIASEATAPPVIEEARDAPAAVAPVLGNGASTSRIRAEWQKRLVAHLDRNKRYPAGAARHTSSVLINFTLDRSGRIVASSIATSSGDASFDEAALDMMKRADPVPAPPPLIADDGLTFTVPVIFRAKGRG